MSLIAPPPPPHTHTHRHTPPLCSQHACAHTHTHAHAHTHTHTHTHITYVSGFLWQSGTVRILSHAMPSASIFPPCDQLPVLCRTHTHTNTHTHTRTHTHTHTHTQTHTHINELTLFREDSVIYSSTGNSFLPLTNSGLY